MSAPHFHIIRRYRQSGTHEQTPTRFKAEATALNHLAGRVKHEQMYGSTAEWDGQTLIVNGNVYTVAPCTHKHSPNPLLER